jgi:hypothetical protein
MRRIFLIACLVAATAVPALAHPGIGIVKDPRGFVFYTDLTQIWQLDPQGRRSIAVPNVHTHELAIDTGGNLIGEEVRGGGNAWQHRILRRAPSGQLSDLVPWTDGFWEKSGLNQDAAANLYWVTCPDRICSINRRGSDGRIVTLAHSTQFHYPISWLIPGPDGSVYFPDGPDLRRLDASGELTTIAAGLAPPRNQNALMGLRVTADGAAYVAVPSRNAVLRVAADGKNSVAARSPALCAPSGILMDADGSIWLLEFDPQNRYQVRHIEPDGKATIY